jgi:hypothetical protein
MAWNNVGFFSLSPGQSIRLIYFFSGLADRGAQHAMAHPINIGTLLAVSDQSKERTPGGGVRYAVTVTNLAPRVAFFSLQGGGFI